MYYLKSKNFDRTYGMNKTIESKHYELADHPMYRELSSIENIRTFMQYHVFAVWDFMSLLKSLQKEITCTTIPWTDSKYNPELVRLINEIVLAEESDVDDRGEAASHFSLYMQAMNEIGADTELIENFLKTYNLELLPQDLKEIVAYHLDLANNGKVHEVASSFFYGREKLIPDMFNSIVKVLKDQNMDCPTLIYYLERHIELDGDEHGPKALQCLKELIDNDIKKKEVIDVACESLEKRWQLWDFIYSQFD